MRLFSAIAIMLCLIAAGPVCFASSGPHFSDFAASPSTAKVGTEVTVTFVIDNVDDTVPPDSVTCTVNGNSTSEPELTDSYIDEYGSIICFYSCTYTVGDSSVDPEGPAAISVEAWTWGRPRTGGYDDALLIDDTAPDAFTPQASEALSNQPVPVRFSCADWSSGLSRFEVAIDGGAYSSDGVYLEDTPSVNLKEITSCDFSLDEWNGWPIDCGVGCHGGDCWSFNWSGEAFGFDVAGSFPSSGAIGFWMKPADSQGGQVLNTIGNPSTATADGIKLVINTDRTLTLSSYDASAQTWTSVTSTTQLPTETWSYVKIGYGATTGLSLDVNETDHHAATGCLLTLDGTSLYLGTYCTFTPSISTYGTSFIGHIDAIRSSTTATDPGLKMAPTYRYDMATEGTHTVHVKAIDHAGNERDGGSATTQIDTTPPSTPTVTDDGAYTTSTTPLHASWTSTDTGTGIAEYQYAVGTSVGATNVVGWTSTGTTAEATPTVSLASGTAYYFSVKAKDAAGNWSGVGNSDGIAVQIPTKALVGGGAHTLALGADGTVWGWGQNSFGQLGNDTFFDSAVPVHASGLSDVTAIAAGLWHSMALNADGTVSAWGDNEYGQLGEGGTVWGSSTPVQVEVISDVTAIAAGVHHSVALESDGTVWAWGYNAFGQLGDGTYNNGWTPAQVDGVSDITAISAGYGHTVALQSDGTVWAWGGNWNGQLGDGTRYYRTAPVHLAGITDVVAISASAHNTFALKSDGTLWGWGSNSVGQLGDDTSVDQLSPVHISAPTMTAIAASNWDHCTALQNDGTVWTWGDNYHGQLGDGTTDYPFDMVSVLTGATGTTAGSYHTLATKGDGTVWAWGQNDCGQLGDGTTTEQHSPVLVGILFAVDTTPPTCTIGAPTITGGKTAAKTGDTVSYGITYADANLSTVNLLAADVTVTTTGTATTGTVTVTNGTTATPAVNVPITGGNGTVKITIAAGRAADLIGNTDAGAGPSAAATVDNAPPTLVIGPPSVTATATGPVTYTVTYSGADTINLVAGNVTLNRTGTANGSIAVSGTGNTTRTVTISSITGDGTLGISIAAGSASDYAGNTAPGATSQTFVVDNTAPTISIGSPSPAMTNAGPVSYTVNYSGADTITLVAANVTLNKTGTANGSVAVTGSGNLTRTVTVSGITGDGTIGISIAAGTASDNVGNTSPSAGPSATFAVDNTAPTISIGSPSASLANAGPVTYTISYSGADAITLVAANVTLNRTGSANGTVSVSGTGNSARTVSISGLTGNGTIGISIAAGTAHDNSANNAPAAGPSATFAVDALAPSGVTVTVDEFTYSTAQLSAAWTAATDNTGGSGVAGYEFAVGTTAGGTDTLGWTSVGNVTSYTQSGLSLAYGTTYWVSVRAVDAAGNRGPEGHDDTIVRKVIYVKKTGNNSNDGSTWALAKLTITSALASAPFASQIRVAAGSYAEAITLGNLCSLLGAYPAAGGDTRNYTSNVTTINAAGTGTSAVTIPLDYSYNSGDHDTVIDGFVIRGGTGTADFMGYRVGGGIYTRANTVISNDQVIYNTAHSGGGIYCGDLYSIVDGAVTIVDSLIDHNTVSALVYQGNTYPSYGGGICMRSSWGQISRNTITNNSASGDYCYGGGIYETGDGTQITRNLVKLNYAKTGVYTRGGGIALADQAYHPSHLVANNIVTQCGASIGAGIYNSSYLATIANNTVIHTYNASNTADRGEAVKNDSPPQYLYNNILAWNGIGLTGFGYDQRKNYFYTNVSNGDITGYDIAGTQNPNLTTSYHLSSTSTSCINQGYSYVLSVLGIYDDYDGQGRYNGSEIDIGADEYY